MCVNRRILQPCARIREFQFFTLSEILDFPHFGHVLYGRCVNVARLNQTIYKSMLNIFFVNKEVPTPKHLCITGDPFRENPGSTKERHSAQYKHDMVKLNKKQLVMEIVQISWSCISTLMIMHIKIGITSYSHSQLFSVFIGGAVVFP